MNSEIFDKIKAICIEIFNCKESEINENTRASDIERWDSLAHINLVLEIEKNFNVKFALGELQDLKNIKDLVELVVVKKNT